MSQEEVGCAMGGTVGLRRLAIAIVAAVGVALVGMSAAPAATPVVTSSHLPSKAKVKDIYNGSGSWFRAVGAPNSAPLGAKPSQCRSDLPFAGALASRGAAYSGPIHNVRKYFGSADVTLYRFASVALASQAIDNASGFAAACPTSDEWVCEECDGIATFHRTPATGHKVGTESVAWNQRTDGMGMTRGHVIVARYGKQVVVVYAANGTDPDITNYPTSASWSRTESLARAALKSARS
jgi:hypothetical protein